MTPDISELVRDLRHMGNASNQFEICNRAAAALTRLSEQTRDMQTRAIAAETRLVEAEGVIHDLLGNFKPFTSRPIGAPHSQARLEQESQVFAHKNATDWINASLSSACAKCGCDTKGEMAFVDNKILCHPCADAVSSPVGGDK